MLKGAAPGCLDDSKTQKHEWFIKAGVVNIT